MPRYFFNVIDHSNRRDTEGTVKPDIAAARHEAVVLAGCLLHDYADTFLRTNDWRIEVTDKSGSLLFELVIQGTDGPVVSGNPRTLRHTAPFGDPSAVGV